MAAGIEDEPALSGTPHAWSAGDDAIGDEPALSESPAAVRDKACRDAAVREMWANRACVGAPVVEEMAKVVLPMMWLEKAPWRFRSAGTIALACLASALVFATIENLLYFHVYIPEDKCDSGIIWFRLIVCTSVHVICTMTSAFGLARAWREARDGACGFYSPAVTPYLVVAMVMHGVYNVFASLVFLWR